MDDGHSRYMQQALALARRNLGQTWPNPAVGAVLVKDGRVIAEGWTGRGGRPHAETVALEAAGAAARGATLYVTLEPCSHHGKTPPCADAIINAGIARVVIACRDPHPEHGGGVEKLKTAGSEIIEHVCEQEARELNRGFFSVVEKNRPYVALKIATSADEKITYHAAARQREGGWITGEAARNHGHRLRSEHDAILTGIGTVLADDPLLTCRLPGLENKSPVRIILDSDLRLPSGSKLAQTAKDVPVWLMAATQPDAGCRMSDVRYLTSDLYHLTSVLSLLAAEGITRLLVEGGQKVTTAFLESGCVDKVYWFQAPVTIGNQGLAALSGGKSLQEALSRFRHEGTENISPDRLEILCSQD